MEAGSYRVSRDALAARGAGGGFDEGLTVTVGGGRSHIGSVAIAQPRPSLRGDGSVSCTCSVWNQPGHKDEAVARPVAERLCRALNTVVVVTAGSTSRRGRGADRSGGAAGGGAGGKAPGGQKSRRVKQKSRGTPLGFPGFVARFRAAVGHQSPNSFAYRTTPSIRTGSSDRGGP
ncbi:MAG: hypothetical protein ACLVL7_12145 [Anaerotruncus massiliensis (ex Togo et al. 2019)]